MTKTLQQQIEEYPAILHKALEEQMKWGQEVARLQEEEEEADEDEMPSIASNYSVFEDEKKLAKLNANIEKWQIKMHQAEGEAEIEHRLGYKATESSSRAIVRSNNKVVEIKLKLVDLEEEKDLLEISMREAREKFRIDTLNHRAEVSNSEGKSNSISKLEKAKSELYRATANVKRVKAMFESYKLLVDLEKRKG